MASYKWVVICAPLTGAVDTTSPTVTLKYGSAPINGRSAGSTISTATEDPVGSGCYRITIPETNQYTIVVSGSPQDELTDEWISGADATSTTQLGDTGSLSGTAGAERIGIKDSGGRYTATTVEGALAEIAGSGRTTETVKANATAITALQSTLSSITNAALVAVCGPSVVIDASAYHTHDGRYYTETEVNTWRNSSTGVITGGGITGVASGANAGPLMFDASGISGNGNGADIQFDTSPSGSGTWGAVEIYAPDSKWYEVVTKYHTGDFDYTGSVFLSRVSANSASALKSALLELDSKLGVLWHLQYPAVTELWRTIWTNPTLAASGALTPGATPTLSSWTQSSGTLTIVARVWLDPTSESFQRIRLLVYGNVAGSGQADVVLEHVTSGVQGALVVKSGDAAWYTSSELVIPSTYIEPQEFTVHVKPDGSNVLTLYANLTLQVQ